MKLKDFRFFDPSLHCVHFVDKRAGSLDWKLGQEIRLVSDRNELVMAQNELVTSVRAADSKTADLAFARLGLWRLAQKGSDHLHLEHAGFQTRLSLDLKVAVDSYLSKQLFADALISENTVISANEWLRDEFVLELNEPLLVARYFKSQQRNDFQLVGKGYSLSIINEGGVWRAKKLTKLRRDSRDVIAIVGNTEFVDDSVAAKIQATSIDVLDQLINDSGSYLSLWETYSKLQWDIATRAAKKLGYFSYGGMSHMGKELPRFRLNLGDEQANEFGKRIKELQHNDELSIGDLVVEIAAEPPSWLLGDGEPDKRRLLEADPY